VLGKLALDMSQLGGSQMPLVRYDRVGDHTAAIILDDPGTRNALSDEMLDDLLCALVRAEEDATVRVVVISSSHQRVFSSGGNLKGFSDDRPVIEKYFGLSRFPELFRHITNLSKPVICKVNGAALAGAFGLVLACDLIVASESATFGCPEITVGVFPFMISALMLRSLGRQQTLRLLLLGEQFSAAQGRDMGFVNEVVPDRKLDETVQAWADRLAGFSPLLLRLGKSALDVSRDLPLSQALDVLQAQLALALTTEDVAEGVAAFREKREPVWRQR
jgi:enoyl-CoA hydratase